MKSINLFITGVLLSGVLATNTSCDKYLDAHPDDIITLDMIFDSEPRVQEWLAGIYDNIIDPTWTLPHDYGFDILADDMQIPLDWQQFNWWPMDAQRGNWSPSNTGQFTFAWTSTYQAVRAAYIFQNRVKALPSQYLSQADVDMMKLEARFLVAYFYSFMLELYGPFPLITRQFDSEAKVEDMVLPRTPFDEIVHWLDREFYELSELLPETFTNEATRYGRPTKGMALACRARMWLFAASPLFNGNPLLANEKNKDGNHLFPGKDPQKWIKAREATEDLLGMGRYELYVERYTNGEIDPFLSFQNIFLKGGEQNPEIIFAVPENGYVNLTTHSSPKGNNNGGNNGYSITQQLVDAFFTKNGLPIDEDGSYQSSGFSSADISFPNTAYDLSTQSRTKGLITPAGAFNMYVNREPRFYITVTYNGLYIPSYGSVTEFFNGGRDGKNSGWDYPPTGYLNRKNVHPEDSPRNNTFPYRPGIIMRLAEFYLNYAEILNEIDYATHRNTIVDYLNRIRKRAGIPLYGSGNGEIAVPADYDAMTAAIRRERRVELAMEGIRYRDMRRWMIGKELYDDRPITGMNTDDDGSSAFYLNAGKKVFLERHWDDKMYLWPIPQNCMDKNSELIQNPGWDTK
ncbi:MAG: RagB/SusD family nutrient uptake outer membrane protein [Bacteroidales bacterium]|nr:RagB/SusD family nutrient uptake outer membrane protein [Bacteroidales bacterium]